MSQVRSFAVTTQNFQAEVMDRSAQVPVLLDFWADWCAPCKTFGPILEQVVDDYGGAFVVGKVNSEQQPQLAQVFQVQSIPFGVLLVKGRPVDGFSEALTDPALRAFLTRNDVRPSTAAAAGESESESESEPEGPAALIVAARRSAAAGDVAGARDALAGIPEDHELWPERSRLAAGLEFLEADLPASGPPAAKWLRQAREGLLAGDLEEALRRLLDSAAADRNYGDGLVPKGMLLCQALHGADHELVDSYRRRLATLLY